MGDPGSLAVNLKHHPFFSSLKQPWAIARAQKLMVRNLILGPIPILLFWLLTALWLAGFFGFGGEDAYVNALLVWIFFGWPLLGSYQALKVHFTTNLRLALPAFLATFQPLMGLLAFIPLEGPLDDRETIPILSLLFAFTLTAFILIAPYLTYRHLWRQGLAYKKTLGDWPHAQILRAEMGASPLKPPASLVASAPPGSVEPADDRAALAVLAGLGSVVLSWLLYLRWYGLEGLFNLIEGYFYYRWNSVLLYLLLLALNITGAILALRFLLQARRSQALQKLRAPLAASLAPLWWIVALLLLDFRETFFWIGLAMSLLWLLGVIILAQADWVIDLTPFFRDYDYEQLYRYTYPHEEENRPSPLQPSWLFWALNWKTVNKDRQRQFFSRFPQLKEAYTGLRLFKFSLLVSLALGLVAWLYLLDPLLLVLEDEPLWFWGPLLSPRALKWLLFGSGAALLVLLWASHRLDTTGNPRLSRNLLAWAGLWLLWPFAIIELTIDPLGGQQPWQDRLFLTLITGLVSPFFAIWLAGRTWRLYRQQKLDFLRLFQTLLQGEAPPTTLPPALAPSLDRPPLASRPAFQLGLVALALLIVAYYRVREVTWSGFPFPIE